MPNENPRFYDDDEDNDRYVRQVALYQRRRDELYRMDIVAYPEGQFYWHLVSRASDERVNGGMNDSWEEALKAASIAAAAAMRQAETPRFNERR
jgi:hypothetical protein